MKKLFNNVHDRILKAMRLEEEGNYGEECIEVNNAILIEMPEHHHSDRRLGMAYYRSHDYLKAVYHLGRYIQSDQPAPLRSEALEVYTLAQHMQEAHERSKVFENSISAPANDDDYEDAQADHSAELEAIQAENMDFAEACTTDDEVI